MDEKLRAKVINRAKENLGKMKPLAILEVVTLLEYIEELESGLTKRAADGAWKCADCGNLNEPHTCSKCGFRHPPRR